MRNWIKIYTGIAIGYAIIFSSGCEKAGPVPSLTTSEIADFTETTATCGGEVTSEGGSPVTARGVCWSINENPTINDSKTVNGSGTGSFTSDITDLTNNTYYYVRAYATNDAGTGYGYDVSFKTKELVSDFDGNVYHTTTIGSMVWMVENLNVTHYRNGDPIPNVTDETTWDNLSTGAYCNYNNSLSNSSTYGKLYNYHAVSDSRYLCPTGWHIPSNNNELNSLIVYWGFGNGPGGKLKEEGTAHWQTPNTGATNIVGFTALPGGWRSGGYQSLGTEGWWWTSSPGDASNARAFFMSYMDDGLGAGYMYRVVGLSVRCVKDN